MTKIKNVSGEDRTIPLLGDRLVLAGQVVEVPEGAVYGFTCQTEAWSPADADAKKEHAAATTTPNDDAFPEES